jgi:predicted RND superfamily exporter protein
MINLIALAARYPWQILVFLALFTGLSATQLTRLDIKVSAESMTVRDDPAVALYQEISQRFPGEDGLIVAFHDAGLFSLAKLETLAGVVKKIDAMPMVERTVSLFNVSNVRSTDGEISSTPFLDPLPESEEQAQEILAQAVANPMIVDNLVSRDGETFLVRVTPRASISERKDADAVIVGALSDVVASVEPVFDDAFVLGPAVLRQAITGKIKADQKQILGLSLVVLLLTLAILMRRFNGAFVPLVTALLSIIWTLGFMGMVGIPVNVMTSIIPALLVIIGSTEDMHLLAEYYAGIRNGMKKAESLRHMSRHMGTAILATGLTTYVGFLSIATNNIELLQQFGVAASTGILFNFLITALFVPAWLRLTDRSVTPEGAAEPQARVAAELAASMTPDRSLRSRAILVGVALIAIAGLVGATRMHVDNNPMGYFGADEPVIKNSDTMHREMAGVETFAVVLRSPIEGTFLKVRYLEQLRLLQDYLDRTGHFDKTFSFADYVAFVNAVLEESDPSDKSLPEADDIVREFFLFIDQEDVADYVTADFREARIIVRHAIGSSRSLREATEGIDAFVSEKLDDGLEVVVTGNAILRMQAADAMAAGQAKSLGLMVVVIWLVITVLFLNPKAGLLAVIPNLFPVVTLFGVMGYLDIPLNTSTAMVAAIALGICVDDTMHFMVRYHHYTRATGDTAVAIERTLRDETFPIVTTTLGLALGFSVFALSSFPPVVHFGFLSAFVMLLALVAVFLVLPSLLATVRLITLYDVLSLQLHHDVLESCSLFQGMTRSQVKKLVLISDVREVGPGEAVVTEGEEGDEMFVVLEGEVEVLKQQPDGQVRQVVTMSPGDVFGETALVTHLPRTATVSTLGKVRLLVLKWESIRRISRFSPRISTKVFLNLAALLGKRFAMK